jgi:putative phosphoribosyl transferase
MLLAKEFASLAAVAALRQHGPARVGAVSVGALETCAEFQDEPDETVWAVTPEPFYAVGLRYGDFSQTADEQAHELLERVAGQRLPVGDDGGPASRGAR